jgi:hypothetical protein
MKYCNIFKNNKVKDSNIQQGNNNKITLQIQSISESVSVLNTRFEDTNKKLSYFDDRIKKIEENRIKHFFPQWIWVLLLTLLCAIIFIWIMLIFQDKYNFEIYNNHTSIILTFVGILATFIVVGNYAQIIEIKKEFEGKSDKLSKRQDIIENYQSFLDCYAMAIHEHFETIIAMSKNEYNTEIYRKLVSSFYHFFKAYSINALLNNESLLYNMGQIIQNMDIVIDNMKEKRIAFEKIDDDDYYRDVKAEITISKLEGFEKLKIKFIDNIAKFEAHANNYQTSLNK